MLLKIHKAHREVIALCDSELIGRNLEEGKTQLDVKEVFYKGDKIDEEKAIDVLMEKAEQEACFNIVGKKACQAAIKAGIVNKQDLKTIQNIPMVLSLL